MTLWTPADLGTLIVGWWDAQTPASMTIVDGRVSAWKSRVNSAHILTSPNVSARPLFIENAMGTGLSAPSYDGADDVSAMEQAINLYGQPGGMTMLSAMKATWRSDNRWWGEGLLSNINSIYCPGQMVVSSPAGGMSPGLIRNSGQAVLAPTNQSLSLAYNGTARVVGLQDSTTSIQSFVDGTAGGIYNYSRSGTLPVNRFGLGALSSNAYYSNSICTIGEILFSGRALTTDERQKVEGYLAWKWNTQANLPAAHPYRTAAPMTADTPARRAPRYSRFL